MPRSLSRSARSSASGAGPILRQPRALAVVEPAEPPNGANGAELGQFGISMFYQAWSKKTKALQKNCSGDVVTAVGISRFRRFFSLMMMWAPLKRLTAIHPKLGQCPSLIETHFLTGPFQVFFSSHPILWGLWAGFAATRVSSTAARNLDQQWKVTGHATGVQVTGHCDRPVGDLVASFAIVVTSASLVETSASLLVTSALLVVTRFAIRIKCNLNKRIKFLLLLY